MNRSFSRRIAVLAAAALFAACGGTPTGTGTPDAGSGTKVTSAKVLTRVGSGTLTAAPGDSVTLSALLSESEVGPVSGATVTWRISDDPGGTTLAGDSSTTSDAGVASMKVTLSGTGTATIRADSQGATSKAVWKIQVAPAAKHLRIIDGGAVSNTDASGLQANVAANVGRQVTLRVKVTVEDGDNEKPVPSDQVTFAFQGTIQGAQFQGSADGTATSQGDGEADIVLAAGTRAGSYAISASIPDAAPVTFNVAVSAGGTGSTCTSSTQCPNGTICQQGACVSAGGGGNGCAFNDRPCPQGYACDKDSGVCKPAFGGGCSTCPQGFHCDDTTQQCTSDNPECSDQVACPTGFDCQEGVCVPGDGSIDVTGHWYTKHDFDIRAALPGWVRFSSTAIRAVDQTLLGQLNLPSWVNALIRGIVQQYIPSWVQQVVYILDNVLTVFSNLRAEGEMDLVANGGPTVLAGTENWTSFVFYFLSQCGTNIGGSLNNPPPCARVDIYTDDLSQADLSVSVDPFAAKVGGSSSAGYTLIMDQRDAHMKLAGILKYVLEQVIQVTTGYPALEDPPCTAGQDPSSGECGPGSGALSHLVDCEGLNQWVQDLGLGIDITALCQVAVSAAGQAIVQQIKQVTVTDDVLQFHGQASACSQNCTAPAATRNGTYADELGYDDFETRASPDGQWTGNFKIGVTVHDVPGRWRASRTPFAVPTSP